MSAPTADVLPVHEPLLFCSRPCLTAYITDVERVGDGVYGGDDADNAEQGLCSHCGDPVNGRSLELPDRIRTAVQDTIDAFLGLTVGRNLFSADDVMDVFLDIRSLINGGDQ